MQSDVCICVMPFCPSFSPLLGPSLLKSGLEKRGISTKVFYFNLKLLHHIGQEKYDKISGADNLLHYLAGELIFAGYLFNRETNLRSYLHLFARNCNKLSQHELDDIVEDFEYVKKLVPAFIDDCLKEVLEMQPRLVGFSTSYYQTCASLSLSEKIKKRTNAPIIFGGANCEGEMGITLLEKFPQIDFVCSGDGDIAFIEFVETIFGNEYSPKINGIISRDSTILEKALTNPVIQMNNLPVPNFEDFFDILKEFSIDRSNVKMSVEMSRGCWWGETHHCTFCGLNGGTMKFRSKSPRRGVDEIRLITKKYGNKTLHFADNIIDPRYFKDFFPKLLEENLDLDIFLETKSNLSKEQLHTIKKLGAHAIQPGLESLSDYILRLMDKGTTLLENVLLLRQCKEIGITVLWNILTRFPGEPLCEYEKMSEIIPLIVHLDPPQNIGRFQLSRFSPYFIYPEKYGISQIRSLPAYSLIYPFEEEIIKKLSYYFDYDTYDSAKPSSELARLYSKIEEWKEVQQHGAVLCMVKTANLIVIKDTRPCRVRQTHVLKDEEACIFEICEYPQRFENVEKAFYLKYKETKKVNIENILDVLANKKILLQNDKHYLSLAVPLN